MQPYSNSPIVRAVGAAVSQGPRIPANNWKKWLEELFDFFQTFMKL